MPVLTVRVGDKERHIPFEADRSLREILDATDIRVRAGCRGSGTCGLCRVRIESGEIDVPTRNEQIILGADQLLQGIRLACQVMPRQDVSFTILAPAPESVWRSLPADHVRRKKLAQLDTETSQGGIGPPYGAAVDVGTSHIRVSIIELSGGTWLAGRYGPNPQATYGSDIMTRLIAASESPEQALDMARLVVEAVRDALRDISIREGLDIGQVMRVSLVGNTAMLALLSGRNHGLLLKPANWGVRIDCLPRSTDDLAARLGIHPGARIDIFPPVAGFVGSDLLAGVVTTGLTESGAGSLFIDFGTNSEIGLWDGETLWVTSAAGGPAFEESGISCGAPAEAGAIHRVSVMDGVFNFEVIAGVTARGICGSGMVDLIACLVRTGLLTSSGRFTSACPEGAFPCGRGDRDIVLTRNDVDLFQRAKGAIGTGIEILLSRSGITLPRRVCVGGFFGRFLDIRNAVEVGLLPAVDLESVELCGSTALAGCEDVLLEPKEAERMMNLREKTCLVEMSGCPEFEELFLKNLYLLPMRGE